MFGNSREGWANALIAGLMGVAILAVFVSKNAQTPAVLNSAGGALGTSLRAAEAPVS